MAQITDGWNKKVYFKVNLSVLCVWSRLKPSLVFSGPVIQHISVCAVSVVWLHDTCVCSQAFCGDPQQLHRV